MGTLFQDGLADRPTVGFDIRLRLKLRLGLRLSYRYKGIGIRSSEVVREWRTRVERTGILRRITEYNKMRIEFSFR
jgi:hypothetical protein